MKNFWKQVNQVISQSDIIMQVLDARFPEESRNKELEEKVAKSGKQLVYVINKADLVGKEIAERKARALRPSVFVSSKERHGMTLLLKTLLRYAQQENCRVGVVGYPNTGKSSVINGLKGTGSAGTSPVSGYTRGIQRIRIHRRLVLLDTPGVIPFREKDTLKHVLLGTLDAQKVKEPEDVVIDMIASLGETLTSHYGVSGDDEEEILEGIARSMNMFRKGGVPDTKRAAIKVIHDWQQGHVRDMS